MSPGNLSFYPVFRQTYRSTSVASEKFWRIHVCTIYRFAHSKQKIYTKKIKIIKKMLPNVLGEFLDRILKEDFFTNILCATGSIWSICLFFLLKAFFNNVMFFVFFKTTILDIKISVFLNRLVLFGSVYNVLPSHFEIR